MQIDIIIPVYGAADLLRACLDSVRAHTDLTRHRVILVIDGPQEVEPEFDGATILRNEMRKGFVASVNRGMRVAEGDVVLLNSDTLVTPRWIEKLIAAAYSADDIATVTPLSNHATLCSVPRAFEENLLPLPLAQFAALVEDVSKREYPRLPTGVGVCLFIRRAALDEVGLFDEERFGFGYGEENDFCLRASARGWKHVADDATFIFHKGHASFGASRKALQKRAYRRLPRTYMSLIADFMHRDPLAPVRARITTALGVREQGRRIVHLVHGWPPFQQAGTEMYAWWLVRQQQQSNRVSVYTRSADRSRADGEAFEWLDAGVRVRFITNNFTARNPLRRNALRDRALERDFEKFLREERPDLLHIHHLAGHAFSLAKVARRLGIPIVLQIQDWWFLCARVNQFDRDGHRCSGPALSKCASCVTLTRFAPSRAMHMLRRSAARAALEACDAFVAGSNAIRDDYATFLPKNKPIHVIPYGVDIAIRHPRSAIRKRPLRFGCVGSVQPHKGLHIAVEAMRGIDPRDAVLHIWGDHTAAPEYAATLDGAVLEGKFAEDEKPRVFASMDVLLMPSIGLESFGLVAREAMACGVPVIATTGGALSEMPAAEFFPPGDAHALRAILRRIIDDPSTIDRWSAQIPEPKRTDAHAAEIERVYESVLRR